MPAVCDPSVDPNSWLLQFEFIKAFVCVYANAAGFLVLGLLVYGAISARIYIQTGSVIIPVVLLLLTGGAVMTQVAAPGVTVAVLMVLVTGAGIMTYVYWRYSA